eukprot:jgi/Chlat1/6922/Chrsp52S00517
MGDAVEGTPSTSMSSRELHKLRVDKKRQLKVKIANLKRSRLKLSKKTLHHRQERKALTQQLHELLQAQAELDKGKAQSKADLAGESSAELRAEPHDNTAEPSAVPSELPDGGVGMSDAEHEDGEDMQDMDVGDAPPVDNPSNEEKKHGRRKKHKQRSRRKS